MTGYGEAIDLVIGLPGNANPVTFTLDTSTYLALSTVLKDKTFKISHIVLDMTGVAGEILQYINIDGKPIVTVPYQFGVPVAGQRFYDLDIKTLFGQDSIPCRSDIVIAKSVSGGGLGAVHLQGVIVPRIE